MKKFDPVSIYERYLDKLSQNPDWKAIVGDSVVSAILKAAAEASAETARYAEHLYKESRWDTAQNTSSIAAAAGQLGYKPARKKSAFGEIYISADPRIHLVGRSIFKEDFLRLKSSGEDVIENWDKPASPISFTRQVEVLDSQGNSYVMSSLKTLEGKGGSDFRLSANSPFTQNTIIQGLKKTLEIPVEVARATATRSKLDPYLFIPIEIKDCEDANSNLTRSFFRVFVVKDGGEEEYRVVDTLHLSGSTDTDVEVYNDLYNDDILYLKFNANKERGKVLNLSSGTGVKAIRIEYIETLGHKGNLTKAFEQFTLTGFAEDPNLKLYGINLDPIIGGTDKESVFDIKRNAPIHYMNSYTVATKEAYERVLKRINFGESEYATKVRVYAKDYEDDDLGTTQKITWASMLIPSLEDRVNHGDGVNPYEDIERLINYYLSELKSPTDVIKFAPPNFVGFAVGIDSTADKEKVDNLVSLKKDIRSTIDEQYGARSLELDFAKPVYSADIISLLKREYPALKSVKLEMEAVKKLNWFEAQRIEPIPEGPIKTIRIPFSFDSLFKGKESNKGFRDFRTGASYVLRLDIFYKKIATSTMPPYHVSIFLKEGNEEGRTKGGFYLKKDGAETEAIWDEERVSNDKGYPFFAQEVYDELEDSYQFYFKKQLYSDSDFDYLISEESLNNEGTLRDHTLTPGALDSFIVWWNNELDEDEDSAGSGYFEFDLKSFYYTLNAYADQDPALRDILNDYPFEYIRCDASDPEVLDGFVKHVLESYIDIYVSMRPVDKDLTFPNPESNNDTVLYIDSHDELSTSLMIEDVGSERRERLISVECDLV